VFEGGLAVIEDAHRKSRPAQDEAKGIGDSGFIVDDKDKLSG